MEKSTKSKRKSNPSKLKLQKLGKLHRIELVRKKTKEEQFMEAWDFSLLHTAWLLECDRVTKPSNLRNLYGDDFARKERQELE